MSPAVIATSMLRDRANRRGGSHRRGSDEGGDEVGGCADRHRNEVTVADIEGEAGGVENIFGTTPRFGDIHWDGMPFSPEEFETITSIDKDAWTEELKLHDELFEKLAHNLPTELTTAKAALAERLAS